MTAGFECLDCSRDTAVAREYYMVRKKLWLAANPSGKGMLCVGCLEKRLGRRLTPTDFTDCLLNTEFSPCGPKSRRLKSRLGILEAA
jgi:hypothetical protein